LSKSGMGGGFCGVAAGEGLLIRIAMVFLGEKNTGRAGF
jgi:hypothetical protein